VHGAHGFHLPGGNECSCQDHGGARCLKLNEGVCDAGFSSSAANKEGHDIAVHGFQDSALQGLGEANSPQQERNLVAIRHGLKEVEPNRWLEGEGITVCVPAVHKKQRGQAWWHDIVFKAGVVQQRVGCWRGREIAPTARRRCGGGVRVGGLYCLLLIGGWSGFGLCGGLVIDRRGCFQVRDGCFLR
jgi:hypothetical protein